MKKLLLSLSLFSIGFAANAQWVEQVTGFTAPDRGLDEIRVVDANTVWCKAYDGVTTTNNVQEFTKTTDGGATWVPGTIDIGDTTMTIGNITAIDANNAWVSAFTATGGGGAWQTTDGGVTWTQQNTSAFTGAASWCDGVHFFDLNNGVAFGDPATSSATDFEAYRTTDGGTTWTSLAAAMPNINAGDYGYAGDYATAGTSAMWIMTAKGKLYRTLDKGATWTKLNTPIADFGAQDTTTSSGKVYFSDANNGILIGNTVSGSGSTATITARKLYKTTNGGTSWDAGVTYTQPYNYNLSYIPGTTTLVGTGVTTVGTTNTYSSAFSNDNGTTWTQMDSGTQRTTIAFANPTTGWAGSFNADAFTGGIYKWSGNLANQQFVSTAFKVYPNPASSVVTISAQNVDSFKLNVIDLTGKTVMTKELNSVENTVDVSNFAAGIYFFQVTSGSKSETIKIMKK